MNISVFIVECIIMAMVFGIFVFGLLLISPLTFISDYPPEIQEEYYRSQQKEAAKKTLTKIMAVKKIAAVLVLLFLTLVFWTGFFLRISGESVSPAQSIWRRRTTKNGFM